MSIQNNYNHTIRACYIGYITQAIVNNFAPLLFLTFQKTYHIPLSQITLLVTLNFVVQLLVDILAAKFVDKIGYRISVVSAHLFCAAGLIGMGVLPELAATPLAGLMISVCCYAIGGGMIEVLISPIVEACPTERKSAVMSLLHSFYCWGAVAVVLISTMFFFISRCWKLEMDGRFMGGHFVGKCFIFYESADSHVGGRRRKHGPSSVVPHEAVLGICCANGLCRCI